MEKGYVHVPSALTKYKNEKIEYLEDADIAKYKNEKIEAM